MNGSVNTNHAVAVSSTSGESWTGFHSLVNLTGASCQQSIVGIPPQQLSLPPLHTPQKHMLSASEAEEPGTAAPAGASGAPTLPAAAETAGRHRQQHSSGNNWTLALSFPTNTSTRAHMVVWRSSDGQRWSPQEVLYTGQSARTQALLAHHLAHPPPLNALWHLYTKAYT